MDFDVNRMLEAGEVRSEGEILNEGPGHGGGGKGRGRKEWE